jgi:hypothetical protein
MMPMIPELLSVTADVELVSTAPMAGPIFLGLLVAGSWLVLLGLLASWMLDRSGRGRTA